MRDDMNNSIREGMESLSDQALLQVLTTNTGEYTDEALAIAKEVAVTRGGIESLERARDLALQPQLQREAATFTLASRWRRLGGALIDGRFRV